MNQATRDKKYLAPIRQIISAKILNTPVVIQKAREAVATARDDVMKNIPVERMAHMQASATAQIVKTESGRNSVTYQTQANTKPLSRNRFPGSFITKNC